MSEYNIPGAYDKLSATDAMEKDNVVVMTWDKVSKLTEADLSEYIIIIDEIHQTSERGLIQKTRRPLPSRV